MRVLWLFSHLHCEVQACPEHVSTVKEERTFEISVANMCVTRIHGSHVVPDAGQPLSYGRLPSSVHIVITVGEHILGSMAPGKISTTRIFPCTTVADAPVTAYKAQLLTSVL
jgi:hypothetical protein